MGNMQGAIAAAAAAARAAIAIAIAIANHRRRRHGGRDIGRAVVVVAALVVTAGFAVRSPGRRPGGSAA